MGVIIDKPQHLQIGQAGEYLAAAALQSHFRTIAFPGIAAPYDLIAESYSGSFLKCQVKASTHINIVHGCRYWKFNTCRSKGEYHESEVDFFALVSLPRRLVYFVGIADVMYNHRIRENEMTQRAEIESLDKVLGKYL